MDIPQQKIIKRGILRNGLYIMSSNDYKMTETDTSYDIEEIFDKRKRKRLKRREYEDAKRERIKTETIEKKKTMQNIKEKTRQEEEEKENMNLYRKLSKQQRRLFPGREKEYRYNHLIFAHLSGMKRTIANKAADGLPDKISCNEQSKVPCVSCIKGKMTNRPHNNISPKQKYLPGERLDIDTFYVPIASIGGAHYWLTVVCKATGMRFGCAMKHKSDAGEKLKSILANIESLTKNAPKRLKFRVSDVKQIRCDRAPEFIAENSEMAKLLIEKGIRITTSGPGDPKQNGTAENANKVQWYAVLANLFESKLPFKFWAECEDFIQTVMNMTLRNKGESKTPIEQFTGKKGSFKDIHPFGCNAMAFVPSQNRSKVESHVVPCIYLSPAKDMQGYRLWNDKTKKIFVATTVLFDDYNSGIETLNRNFHEGFKSVEGNRYPLTEQEFATILKQSGLPEHRLDNDISVEGMRDIKIEGMGMRDTGLEETKASTTDISKSPSDSVNGNAFQPDIRYSRRTRTPTQRYIHDCINSMIYAVLQKNIGTEPKGHSNAMKGPDGPKWWKSELDELAGLVKNKTWELVPMPDTTDPKVILMNSLWTYRHKMQDNVIVRYKSRLCAGGQHVRSHPEEVYAPVARHPRNHLHIPRSLKSSSSFNRSITSL